MNAVKGIGGGLAGGLVGAAIWAAVGHFTGLEAGWVAWAVGALAGIGVRLASGREERRFDKRLRRMVRTRSGMGGTAAGALAAAAAIVSVLVGKYLLLHATVPVPAEASAVEYVDAETMKVYLADEIASEYRLEGKELAWPPGIEPFESFAPEHFPPDVWSAAESQWSAMTDEDKRAYTEQVGEAMGSSFRLAESESAVPVGALGLYDLLWLGLAAATAFKIASSGRG